ncbi:paired-like homeodomain transcription factor LEUTX [Pteropus medius]|uniref:paired-like homeodomain transcription factor LEUTX n=1 Tax=Pteropus vampyrus TaxID=132908 RepID=UPI00196B3636|nr:paired-like homeodomain transcription factor LEUTX [Pteropus giganteus]
MVLASSSWADLTDPTRMGWRQEKPRSARRHRTTFSPKQLRILKETFEKTMYPHWFIITALTTVIHLDESVIKTWFKNQRIKRRKQQQLQTRPLLPLEAPNQTISVKEEETPSPATSTDSHPVSEARDHDPPKAPGIEQPGGAGASAWNASWDSQPHDLQEMCLEASDIPWATIPYDIDQFIRFYALPGDDHPNSLDQYLFPKQPG